MSRSSGLLEEQYACHYLLHTDAFSKGCPYSDVFELDNISGLMKKKYWLMIPKNQLITLILSILI